MARTKGKAKKAQHKRLTDCDFTTLRADDIHALIQKACYTKQMPAFFMLVYAWTPSQYDRALLLAWNCLQPDLTQRKPKKWNDASRADAESKLHALDLEDALFTQKCPDHDLQIWDDPKYYLPWLLARERHGDHAATILQAFLTWTWYERGRDIRAESKLLDNLNKLRQKLLEQAKSDQQQWKAYKRSKSATERAGNALRSLDHDSTQAESPIQSTGNVIVSLPEHSPFPRQCRSRPGLHSPTQSSAAIPEGICGGHVFGQTSLRPPARPIFSFTQ